VREKLKDVDIEGKFFREHIVPEFFFLEGRVYYFSYYLLPYEAPVDPPPPP